MLVYRVSLEITKLPRRTRNFSLTNEETFPVATDPREFRGTATLVNTRVQSIGINVLITSVLDSGDRLGTVNLLLRGGEWRIRQPFNCPQRAAL